MHGLEFDLHGRRRSARGAADLTGLDLRLIGDLIFVRSAQRRRPEVSFPDPWASFAPPAAARPIGPPADTALAADWKLVAEQWLSSTPGPTRASRQAGEVGWSARSYRQLMGSSANLHWQRRFFPPNHMIEVRPDGFSILQLLPTGPGRSLLRQTHFTLCEADRSARAAQYLAFRLSPFARLPAIVMADSTQAGIVVFGHEAADAAPMPPGLEDFRRRLAAAVPALG